MNSGGNCSMSVSGAGKWVIWCRHLSTSPTAQCVLDVACGAGGWLLEMARAFPHIQFIGLNTSEDMVERASEQASQEGEKKATFLEHTMASIDQLPFPHATFDLINIAFIARYLLTLDYAALARSLYP